MKKNSRSKRPKRNSGKQRRAHAPQITAQQVALLWRLLREANDIAQRIPSDEMQAVVQRLCGEFYALGSEALEAIRYALEVKKDARIAYQILNVLGGDSVARRKICDLEQADGHQRSYADSFSSRCGQACSKDLRRR